MKKLGFGLMRLPLLDPTDEASIDMEQFKNMVDLFLEKGFTYFDTAWMYQGFTSERAAKEALVDRHPRESFTLATKLHAPLVFKRILFRFFQRIGKRYPQPDAGFRFPCSSRRFRYGQSGGEAVPGQGF